MKKKAKPRRKKKDVDDDISFLDSMVAENKEQYETQEKKEE